MSRSKEQPAAKRLSAPLRKAWKAVNDYFFFFTQSGSGMSLQSSLGLLEVNSSWSRNGCGERRWEASRPSVAVFRVMRIRFTRQLSPLLSPG